MSLFISDKKYAAQGTIEYLVIIGVIVVVSLVVVGLVISLTSSPVQQILTENEKLEKIGAGGIVITQAASDEEGGVVIFRNHSGDDLFLP